MECGGFWPWREWGIVMFTVFLEHRLLSMVFLILLLLSIICQIIIGVIFRRMIKETDNMSATANKRLKQCKLKFVSCYQLNGSVANVSVFVDKFLTKLTFMGISLTGLQHLAGQLILLSVVVAGIGACREIIQGETFGKVLPYYIVSFLALYVYFSISGLVDVQGKRERLKISLVDYLENHMVNKLRQSAIDWEGLTGEQITMIKERLEQEKRERPGAGIWPEDRERSGSRMRQDDMTGEKAEDRIWPESMTEEAERGILPKMQQKAAGAENLAPEETAAEGKAVSVFSRQDEQELEELLREFFA